jgi:energy-coupling factor transporter ATP-binding protein EcfA2
VSLSESSSPRSLNFFSSSMSPPRSSSSFPLLSSTSAHAPSPRSGLDGQSAYNIVRFLRKLAAAGQAVLCTIHQPNSMLFENFDRLLLLKAGGRTVYFGDIGKDSHVLREYLAENGAYCPDKANPAECPSSSSSPRLSSVVLTSFITQTCSKPSEPVQAVKSERPTGRTFGSSRLNSQRSRRRSSRSNAMLSMSRTIPILPSRANVRRFSFAASFSNLLPSPSSLPSLPYPNSAFNMTNILLTDVVHIRSNATVATPFWQQLNVVTKRSLLSFYRSSDYGWTRLFNHIFMGLAMALGTSLSFLSASFSYPSRCASFHLSPAFLFAR